MAHRIHNDLSLNLNFKRPSMQCASAYSIMMSESNAERLPTLSPLFFLKFRRLQIIKISIRLPIHIMITDPN